MLAGIKIGISLYVYNLAQEVICFARMFYLQNRCDCLVDCSCTIISQFFWLKKSALFSATDKLDGFAQFSFQGKVRERSMMFILRLIFVKFSGLSHSGIICVFHKLVKRPTVPEIELKQYALSNLRGIINALYALEDNGFKNCRPLYVTLPSTNPVKFYIQDSHKSLPGFPGRCVLALGRHTTEFFPQCLPLTVFRNSSIHVVSWILVHPILVDTIYHVVSV